MIIRLHNTLRNAMGQQIIDGLSAGSAAGKVEFYTAPMPADSMTAVTTQTKLGTLALSDPAGTLSNGVITFAAIAQDNAADASGDAAWCRMTDSDGGNAIDLDVGNAASSAACKLNTVSIVAGGPIRINSAAIAIGG